MNDVCLFSTLTPDQQAQLQSEACGLVSAAKSMGIHLELSDLRDLATQRFNKQIKEAIADE